MDMAEGAMVEVNGQMIPLTQEQLDQLQEMHREQQAQRDARLANLAVALADKRREAIQGRKQSGVEDEWIKAEDAFQGEDDATRRHADWNSKPPGQRMPEAEAPRSTVLPNITRPYVETAVAKIGDMLLPTDDRAFAVLPTPVPELAEFEDDETPVPLATGSTTTPAEAIQTLKERSQQYADRAQEQIDDWLTECQWHGELRELIMDCAKLGSGVLKGPFPRKRKHSKWVKGEDGRYAVVIEEKVKPISRKIDVWNFFPDPACGESIHDGSYTWERDKITGKRLAELRGMEGYLDEQIDACIEEGPLSAVREGEPPQRDAAQPGRDKLYEIWYFHGLIEREDLEAAGCECGDDAPSVGDGVFAQVTMVNDRIVKAALNPLDTGDFPYDVIPWQKVRGRPWGNGLASQISVPQRILTAAVRAMMDNAGRSAGPQVLVNRELIEPEDGRWEIVPWKTWVPKPGQEVPDMDRAFRFVTVAAAQGDLMAIVQFAIKMAEDVTGMPLMFQGQQGRAPDTLGGMQLLNNNASSTLRRLARLFDDHITEPHIGRYYDWLMQYGEDEAMKGEYVIDARGSSALVERALQNERIMQMAPLVLNPAFGIDPKRWFAEMSKSQHLDPKRYTYTDEELKQMAAQQQEQPADPRVVAAQAKLQDSQENRQFEGQQRAMDRDHEFKLAMIEREIQAMELAGEQNIGLDKVKAMLAGKAIDAQTKKQLFAAERALKLQTGQGI